MECFKRQIIFKMIKLSKPLLLVLAYLLLIGEAQNLRVERSLFFDLFEGAQLPHIFSQYMDLDPAIGNVDFNQDYTLTIP